MNEHGEKTVGNLIQKERCQRYGYLLDDPKKGWGLVLFLLLVCVSRLSRLCG